MSSSAPTYGEVVSKTALEILGMILLVLPLAYIYAFTSKRDPYHRGFFCDDQNLKHPYLEQTVPIMQCLLSWVAFCSFFILLVESLRSIAARGSRRPSPIPGSPRPPWIAVELYRHFGYWGLGALGCLTFTEVAKFSIGRLRPHFFSLCAPHLTDELCLDSYGYQKFVTENEDTICQGLVQNGGNVTKAQLHEARLSFLSGHASFSFYCSFFLVVYLQARLSNFPYTSNQGVRTIVRILKVLRPFIQFGMIIFSLWISLTRVSDYFHHPFDVATGALVGISFAGITLVVIADIFNKHSTFWRIMENHAKVVQINDYSKPREFSVAI